MTGTGSATRRLRITAFGASSVATSEALYHDIHTLGQVLGEQGWDASTGGHQGLMGAFAEGVRAGGGCVRGIMLTRFPAPPENALSEEIRAYDFFDRMRTLIEEADAWVVLPGGLGTLAEFAMSWDLAAIGVLESRPLIVYGDMWQAIIPTLSENLLFSKTNPMPLLQCCTTPEEVLAALAGTVHCDAV
jgi:hypothetical protein